MGRKVLVLSLFVAALSALIGERFIRLRKRALATREVTQNHLPNCQFVKGLVYGSEDIHILPNGLAIISTGLKYPGLSSPSDSPGKIYALDLDDSRLKPVELRIGWGLDFDSFNPHGISVYNDENDGSVYLFVVNHPHHESRVEIFKFLEEENTLVYLKSIKHELLNSVNDIVAVGPESFYATNDQYFSYEILKRLAPFLGLPWSNVVYYSPEEVRVVADGFYMANGINISPDKRHIYVADFFDHSVHVLDKLEDKSLAPVKIVEVGTLVDNIDVDTETGDLWLGCHPNVWKLLLNNPEEPPGSEVIQIQSIHSEKPVVTQVYADNGSVLIGSSVAARYGGKLLIGTVYHRALCCDLE